MTSQEKSPADAVWKRRLLDRVEELGQRPEQTTKWGTRLTVRVIPAFLALIHAAAGARGMTVGGYIRRSVAKQLAIDLDMPIEDILRLTPYPSVYGSLLPPKEKCIYNGRGRTAVYDDGTGYGDWAWPR